MKFDPLTMYVPRYEHPQFANIIRGSAIVGSPAGEWQPSTVRFDGAVVIDYEGNKYGAHNIITLADRASVAAGRHREHYPTVARMQVAPEHLIAIGDFDGEQIDLTDNQVARRLLDEWIGSPPPLEYAKELHLSGAWA